MGNGVGWFHEQLKQSKYDCSDKHRCYIISSCNLSSYNGFEISETIYVIATERSIGNSLLLYPRQRTTLHIPSDVKESRINCIEKKMCKTMVMMCMLHHASIAF